MMTASIVDDLTDTTSNKNRECVGQGIANIATGFIGGMAGCAMIGQSVINVKSGGRGPALDPVRGGVFLLVLVVFLGDWVGEIPMAALVAVMIMVSIGTFSWESIRNLREHPPSSSIVMVATVVVIVRHARPGQGRARRRPAERASSSPTRSDASCASILQTSDGGRTRTYRVVGQVFFASAERLRSAPSTSRKSSSASRST